MPVLWGKSKTFLSDPAIFPSPSAGCTGGIATISATVVVRGQVHLVSVSQQARDPVVYFPEPIGTGAVSLPPSLSCAGAPGVFEYFAR